MYGILLIGKISCVVRCVLLLECNTSDARVARSYHKNYPVSQYLYEYDLPLVDKRNVLAGAVVRWGNSTKTNSSYSPDPIVSISATVIGTFLSVDIYMMNVAYMFTFL